MDQFSSFLWLSRRPRRNRQHDSLRALICETHLHPSQFVAPLFVVDGMHQQQPIDSMPGIFRYSLDQLIREIDLLATLGIKAVNLFCYTPRERKDERGSEAIRQGNLLQQVVRLIKQEMPSICVIVDIALDPFTSHGHDGVLNQEGIVDNDATLPLLGEMALRAAEVGVDIVAPSDMMDGRVRFIRHVLDRAGYCSVGILSYTAKYASAFYGPFRAALDSAPQQGDKRHYQMNPANGREALLECQLDEEEGADLLLVKPALPYLDILAHMRKTTNLPLGAYHVSGEYAMVMAAAQRGWIDAEQVFYESLLSIKRAGADFILSYAAKQVAQMIKRGGGKH